MTTAVGDTLMCTPALRSLRKAFPRAHIAVMVDRRRKALLVGNSHLDQLIEYPGKFKRVIWLIRQLRRLRPDLAIVLHGNDPDIVPLVYLSGAGIRAGWAESAFAFLFTHPVPRLPSPTHFIAQRGRILEELGIELDSWRMEVSVQSEDEKFVALYLQEHHLLAAKTLLVLHPFASKRFRWWPERHVRQLVHLLGANLGDVGVVLLGGDKEKEAVRRLLAAGPPNVYPAVEGFHLGRLVALIGKASVFVGVDSGPLHVATAMDIPRVGLYGPQLPEEYAISSEMAVCLQAAVDCLRPCRAKNCLQPKCMEEISPKLVYDAVLRLLARIRAEGKSRIVER